MPRAFQRRHARQHHCRHPLQPKQPRYTRNNTHQQQPQPEHRRRIRQPGSRSVAIISSRNGRMPENAGSWARHCPGQGQVVAELEDRWPAPPACHFRVQPHARRGQPNGESAEKEQPMLVILSIVVTRDFEHQRARRGQRQQQHRQAPATARPSAPPTQSPAQSTQNTNGHTTNETSAS